MCNLVIGFLPLSGTPIYFMVMCSFLPLSSTSECFMVMYSIGYPFQWNWNSGASVTYVNLIGSVPPLTGELFPRISTVFRGVPFVGGTDPLGSYPFSRDSHASSGLPFFGNVNVPMSYPISMGDIL
jgi:hypothetical protein